MDDYLHDEKRFCSLAYIADVFRRFALKKSLHSANISLFFVQDKSKALVKKLELAIREIVENKFIIEENKIDYQY